MNSSLPSLGSRLDVYIDTEFTDFVNQDLISIGLVASNGQEFYGENLDFKKEFSSEWVQQNIYQLLDANKFGMKRYELSSRVWQWLDDLECDFVRIMIDYKSDYDLLLDLLGEPHPKIINVQNIYQLITAQCAAQTELSLDVNASEQKIISAKNKFNLYFMDYFYLTKEIQHHALSDARANKLAYEKVAKEFGFGTFNY